MDGESSTFPSHFKEQNSWSGCVCCFASARLYILCWRWTLRETWDFSVHTKNSRSFFCFVFFTKSFIYQVKDKTCNQKIRGAFTLLVGVLIYITSKPDVQANVGHWPIIIKLISFHFPFPQTSLPLSFLRRFPNVFLLPYLHLYPLTTHFLPPLIHFPHSSSPYFSHFLPSLVPSSLYLPFFLIPYPFSYPALSSSSLNSFPSLLRRLETDFHFISFPERTAGY